MRILIAAALLGGIMLLTTGNNAQAEVFYPWCARYGGVDGGGDNCGFTSYPQCAATVSGSGGYCYRNPAYQPQRYAPRRQKRRVIIEE